ncbi:MAG TPA: LysM peptidoglycan-binding domain-containing protein, partial [Pseudoneobacillus sp.]|nr:LysM peptidoglycan-binding domain-containing protein [Pseudoneobacillus sp.]
LITKDRTYLLKDEGFNKSILWEKNFGGNEITFDDQYFYLADNTLIRAINNQTGELKWTYTFSKPLYMTGTISASDDKIFAITEIERKLFALQKSNGQVVWTASFSDFALVPFVAGDKVFISGQPTVYAHNTSNGAIAWKKPLGFSGFYRHDISANENTIYGRTSSGMLIGITKDGTVKFNVSFKRQGGSSSSRGPLLVTSNQLILEYEGKIQFYDINTGNHEHTIAFPNEKIEPVLITDHYLIANSGNKLYVFATPKDEQYVDPDGNVQPEQPPAPDPVPPNQQIYVVKAGDTLWKIANQFGTTVHTILDINKLDPTAYLWVGQNLTVPKPQKTHIVQSGETLWKIANQYNVPIQNVIDANKLGTNVYIWVGQKLIIPEMIGKVYIVQSGDTLWKIANQFNTTIQAINDANKLSSSAIWIGQKLLIP